MGNGFSVQTNINVIVHNTRVFRNQTERTITTPFESLLSYNVPIKFDKSQAIIFCNSYERTPHALGEPAKNDGVLAFEKLTEEGYSCLMFHDVKKKFITDTLKNLLSSDAERILVYYIGHGVNTYTSDAKYEKSGADSAFYAMDGLVVDNELRNIINSSLKKNRQVRLISDCCHSGSMYDLEEKDFREYNIISIGACGDRQTAKQDYICRRGNGVFSYYFWKYYTKDITLSELLSKVNEKLQSYRQRCESSIDNLIIQNETFKVL